MKNELNMMAEGLPGHLHTFYRLVQQAKWLGGDQEYSPLNEAWPYYFNWIVPLAYGARDQVLIAEVRKQASFVLSQQFADGWLGPEADISTRNFWGRYPFLLGLAQLIEADPENSEPFLDAIHKFMTLMNSMLANDYQGYVRHDGDTFDEQWGRSRAADMVLFLQWLFENHPRNQSRVIHENMMYMTEKAYDWSYWYSEAVFIKEDLDTKPEEILGPLFPFVHNVNTGQGFKALGVERRLSHDDSKLSLLKQGVDWTFQYHGNSAGAIIGDERLSGLSPVRGAELCGVVETMYSLNYLYQATGDRSYADRAELTAYNALPVMIWPDFWSHQYVASSNQPVSHLLKQTPFWNVGPMGQVFGTEPQYPCCTVNHGQGWPKWLSNSFVRQTNGIVHMQLMPAEVNTTVRDSSVYIKCSTNYPFEHVLNYTIHTLTNFTFSFRVPAWADPGLSTMVTGQASKSVAVRPSSETGLQSFEVPAGITTISVQFFSGLRVETRKGDTIAVYHGPLLYALPIENKNTSQRPEHYPGDSAPERAVDWIVEPTKDAVYSIAIDPRTLELVDGAACLEEDIPSPIWTVNATRTRVKAMACKLSNWVLTSDEGGYLPDPPPLEHRRCHGRPFEVMLQPYGSLKVHISEFPTIDLGYRVGEQT